MGEYLSLIGSRSITIGPMRRATGLLAEVLVLKGMSVGSVLVFAGDKVVELMHGVGVTTHEGSEPEGGRGD